MENKFEEAVTITNEIGYVIEIKYPILIVTGLPTVTQNELVLCESGELGQVFEIKRDKVVIILFSQELVPIGTRITRLKKPVTFPLTDNMLGGIYDPLGNEIMPRNIAPSTQTPIEKKMLNVSGSLQNFRTIKNQFYTGINIIDMLVPIGKGQKQLIIGDRKTGKRAVAMQAARAAMRQGIITIYAGIGLNAADTQRIYQELKSENNMQGAMIIGSNSVNSPGLIFLTPYAAVTVAEIFRDRGNDVLVILDDLTTHAQIYRELSLIAGRFPGRESYPGDMFYVHAQLMERAGNYQISPDKEASITVLPLVHISDGELTTYISTNSIGMSDGHIFLDRDLFLRGIRPPVNIGLSVTRAGKQTQTKLLRDINRQTNSFYAQYTKMQEYSRFGGEMTDNITEILAKGERINHFFRHSPDTDYNIKVEVMLFGLIWAEYFVKEKVEKIELARHNLLIIAAQPDGKAFLNSLTSVNTLEEMIKEIKNVDGPVKKICELEQ